jgi:hypothetical protein
MAATIETSNSPARSTQPSSVARLSSKPVSRSSIALCRYSNCGNARAGANSIWSSIDCFANKSSRGMAGGANCVGHSVICRSTTKNFAVGWGTTPSKTSSPCASLAIEVSMNLKETHTGHKNFSTCEHVTFNMQISIALLNSLNDRGTRTRAASDTPSWRTFVP